MACPTLVDPACIVSAAGRVAGSAVADGAVSGIASAIQSGIAWVVSGTVDWWIQVPSPDLAAEPVIGALQRWLLPVTVAVAVLAMITAAAKMALTRKANPLFDVGSGLAIVAATSAVGVLLPSMLLKAGDAWSSWVLAESTGGQFGSRLETLLALPGAASGVVIVLGICAIVMAAIQAVLMLFRQAAVIILAGVLPLAAAGTLAPATRAWFRRVTGWMLALIFYKPAAAAVYATAFTMIGTGKDPRTTLMGFAMVLISLLALPALMKLFTWTTGAVETAASGGGFLGTMVTGAVAIGALRGSAGGAGGSSSVDQARLMAGQLRPQGAAGPAGSGSPGSGAQRAASSTAGPSGPGPATTTASGSGASTGAAPPVTPAAGTGAAAAAAGGPAAAAAGLASGAAKAARQAADATQPTRTED
jgi:hypothetical protein